MSIKIGDMVLYEYLTTLEGKSDIPTIRFEILKVKGIKIEGAASFIDSNDVVRDKYRVRYIFRKGEKDKIINEDYDEQRIAEETGKVIERFKRENIIKKWMGR